MTTSPHGWDESDDELLLRYNHAFVLRRAEQINIICDVVTPLPEHEAVHLLDLGCGAGDLTAALLQRHPRACVTGLDTSDAMLRAAAERLEPFGDRARLIKASPAEPSWRIGGYAAIVSSRAAHCLNDVARWQLYRDLHSMLLPGGRLVLADVIPPPTASARVWAACGDVWAARQAIGPTSAPAVADSFHAARRNTCRPPDPVDRPATLVQHLRWLDEAGFDGTDLCWALAGHLVIAATGGSRGRGAR